MALVPEDPTGPGPLGVTVKGFVSFRVGGGGGGVGLPAPMAAVPAFALGVSIFSANAVNVIIQVSAIVMSFSFIASLLSVTAGCG